MPGSPIRVACSVRVALRAVSRSAVSNSAIFAASWSRSVSASRRRRRYFAASAFGLGGGAPSGGVVGLLIFLGILSCHVVRVSGECFKTLVFEVGEPLFDLCPFREKIHGEEDSQVGGEVGGYLGLMNSDHIRPRMSLVMQIVVSQKLSTTNETGEVSLSGKWWTRCSRSPKTLQIV